MAFELVPLVESRVFHCLGLSKCLEWIIFTHISMKFEQHVKVYDGGNRLCVSL